MKNNFRPILESFNSGKNPQHVSSPSSYCTFQVVKIVGFINWKEGLNWMKTIINWIDVGGSVHHSIIRIENPKRCHSVSKFYFIFIWSSTYFGRHTAYHQESKTALAASGFACVDVCWTCSCNPKIKFNLGSQYMVIWSRVCRLTLSLFTPVIMLEINVGFCIFFTNKKVKYRFCVCQLVGFKLNDSHRENDCD
jgi:hypothetical protein